MGIGLAALLGRASVAGATFAGSNGDVLVSAPTRVAVGFGAPSPDAHVPDCLGFASELWAVRANGTHPIDLVGPRAQPPRRPPDLRLRTEAPRVSGRHCRRGATRQPEQPADRCVAIDRKATQSLLLSVRATPAARLWIRVMGQRMPC
jgi:hypothetical protein